MPRGFQWSIEDVYNAKRQADIQADAMRRAMREEFDRQQRLLEEQARRRPAEDPVEFVPRAPHVPSIGAQILQEAQRVSKQAEPIVRENRARKAREAKFGSAAYIQARYSKRTWKKRIQEYCQKFNCTAPEAAERLVREYKEEEWREYEDPLLEQLLREN